MFGQLNSVKVREIYLMYKIMNKDSGEELIGTAPDLETANEIRYHLARLGTRLWFLVMQNSSKAYDIYAATEWCGRLPEAHLIILRDATQKLLNEKVLKVDVDHCNEIVLSDADMTEISASF